MDVDENSDKIETSSLVGYVSMVVLAHMGAVPKSHELAHCICVIVYYIDKQSC